MTDQQAHGKSTRVRAKAEYPPDAQDINKTSWFYLTKRGVHIVAEDRKNGTYHGTGQTTLTWGRLKAALRVHETVKRGAKR